MTDAGAQPVFHRDGDVFTPTAHAAGPWDPGQQHGGAPAALLAGAMEALAPGFVLARLTVDFLGSVALAPLTVVAEVVRPGRRMVTVEGSVRAEGREACRARAVLLRRGALEGLPPGAPAPPLPEGPEAGRTSGWFGDASEPGFHRTAMDIRFTEGGAERGPAVAWFRLARPLVDGEEASGTQLAVAAADFGNGVSRELPFDGSHLFVNTDLTVHLHRHPAGAWVALDARTVLDPAGVGLAHSTLHDERGPLGLAAQSLFVDRSG